jgi:hypothetical protein
MAHLLASAAQGDEHIAGRQGDLEGDEQVEQVAGEECEGDPRGHDQVHGMEDGRLVLGPALADREHEHGQHGHEADREHQAGEEVGHEGDAERGRPPSGLYRLGAVTRHGDEQGDGDAERR